MELLPFFFLIIICTLMFLFLLGKLSFPEIPKMKKTFDFWTCVCVNCNVGVYIYYVSGACKRLLA